MLHLETNLISHHFNNHKKGFQMQLTALILSLMIN